MEEQVKKEYIKVVVSCEDRHYARIDIIETKEAQNNFNGNRQLFIKRSDKTNGESFNFSYNDISNNNWISVYLDPLQVNNLYFYEIKCEFYNANGEKLTEETVISQSISLDNSIYLFNAIGQSVRIAYNPAITGYKRVTQEGILQPLGSQYPLIRRNGDINYTTFNLTGLLSYQSELVDIPDIWIAGQQQQRIIDNEPLVALEGRFCRANSILINQYSNIDPENCSVAEITLYKEFTEQNFKKQVVNFLYDPNPKYLLSSTDDIMKPIYLTNISFTPEKQLGRILYSFSATCTEVNAPIPQLMPVSGLVM